MPLTLLDLSEAKKTAIQASGKTLTLNQPQQWADMFVGLRSHTGKEVNARTALRASAVLACIRILMEDVAAPPLILKKNTPQGPKDATEHELYRLLKVAPNSFQTSVEMREHLMMDCLLFGRWAAWVERDGGGHVIAIHPLLADCLSFMEQRANGDIVWQYTSQYLTRQFTQNDLWRGQIMSRTTFDGHSLILLAREAIGLALAAEEQGARLFNHGIQTDVVVTTPETLDEAGKEGLRNALQDTYGGVKNAYKALLLEGGLDIKRIGLTAQESQFLEARNYQLADIARIFRVPTVMLGIIGDRANTYASTEQFFMSYEKHCLRPWCNRFEQTISRDLLLPSEQNYFAKHDLTDLLRADLKTRYESYAIGINAGFLNRNEPRAWEGFQTRPELDAFLMPLNMQEAGKEDEEPPTGATPPTPPQPSVPKMPQAPPQGPQKGPKDAAERLACLVAAQVLNKEQKWFTRQAAGQVTAEQLQGFPAWHTDLVLQATAASAEEVREYCEWRNVNREAHAEATEKLIRLCLEANREA